MKIEFDEAKDAKNHEKHGISLFAAAEMNLDLTLVVEDTRFDYGERRFLAYGPIGKRVHVMYFTMRGSIVRVIGLRKANLKERRRYEKEQEGPQPRYGLRLPRGG